MIGFTRSIEPMLETFHQKALILGTGGAAKAIDVGLRSLGITTKFVSRTPRQGVLTYQDITPAVMNDYRIVVNCTPVGMYPHADTCPPLPYEAMDMHHLLYDLIYNPDETLFLKKGAEHGATIKNGLEMFGTNTNQSTYQLINSSTIKNLQPHGQIYVARCVCRQRRCTQRY